MGLVPEQDSERNKNLIADYQAKEGSKFVYSTAQLVGKYGITGTRIYELLDKYNIPRRSPRRKK